MRKQLMCIMSEDGDECVKYQMREKCGVREGGEEEARQRRPRLVPMERGKMKYPALGPNRSAGVPACRDRANFD